MHVWPPFLIVLFINPNHHGGRICYQADRAQKLLNDKYDEAVEVSQSMDQGMGMKMEAEEKGSATGGASSRPNITSLPEEKTNSFMNKPFDEALEFSQSNSDESVDTRGGDMARNNNYSSDAKKSPMPAGNLQPQSQAVRMFIWYMRFEGKCS